MTTFLKIKQILKELFTDNGYQVRRKANLLVQKNGGYQIEIMGRGEQFIYKEGDREIEGQLTWIEGYRFYAASIEKWDKPVKDESLTTEQFQRVLCRVCDFLNIHYSEFLIVENPKNPLAAYLSLLEKDGWQIIDKNQNEINIRRVWK